MIEKSCTATEAVAAPATPRPGTRAAGSPSAGVTGAGGGGGAGVRLAVGGVADRPTARDLPLLDGSALDDALNAFAWDLGAGEDVHATARYRRDLVRHLGRQVIEEALRCRN